MALPLLFMLELEFGSHSSEVIFRWSVAH